MLIKQLEAYFDLLKCQSLYKSGSVLPDIRSARRLLTAISATEYQFTDMLCKKKPKKPNKQKASNTYKQALQCVFLKIIF